MKKISGLLVIVVFLFALTSLKAEKKFYDNWKKDSTYQLKKDGCLLLIQKKNTYDTCVSTKEFEIIDSELKNEVEYNQYSKIETIKTIDTLPVLLWDIQWSELMLLMNGGKVSRQLIYRKPVFGLFPKLYNETYLYNGKEIIHKQPEVNNALMWLSISMSMIILFHFVYFGGIYVMASERKINKLIKIFILVIIFFIVSFVILPFWGTYYFTYIQNWVTLPSAIAIIISIVSLWIRNKRIKEKEEDLYHSSMN